VLFRSTKVCDPQGNLGGISIVNTSASPIFIKLYSSVSAPTVGTTVPILTIQCAASTFRDFFVDNPVCIPNSIWVAVTGAAADNDATAVTAGPIVHVFYE